MRTGTKTQIKLILIRHGATKANAEHRYLGKTEEYLSEEGKESLLKYKKEYRYPKVAYLFTSPMLRCRETADILYPGRKSILIPEWEEMNFGVFEGKNYVELQDDKRYQEWIDSNGTLPFPEGESREEFILRCDKGFQRMRKLLWELEQESCDEPKTVGAIVHGGTIMALLSKYYGGEYFDYQVSNGGGYVCMVEEGHLGAKIIEIKEL